MSLVTDVEFLPFGLDVVYAKVTSGENEYFRIYCIFVFEGKKYGVYAFTLDPQDVQLAIVEKFEEGEDGYVNFIFAEIVDHEEFNEVAAAWNAHLEEMDEKGEDPFSAE